ncbi:hypothetical protein BCR37DRAFT_395233 [Protomyces lactucae-debilis]|uniref:Phosphoribulokinase/uridine kinase domain-containing protein n=1 Tax=Protomyces lactucae-debilis TaxID=2754530 RepID=A0A1Y2F167_PROLT|nr:uncharacterized protein BCR37DRAFT_395233 [Protomyces lactucae-debilis]ORY76705.1 hypothetical protein BCR37DRAFT_395233 [Protomyces lactucae-debilis]
MLLVVTIAGGAGARKHLLAKQLSDLLQSRYSTISTAILSLEDFKKHDVEEVEEPSGLSLAAVIEKIDAYAAQSVSSASLDLQVLFVEGVYAMLPELREKSDLRIFIDTDADTRLSNTVLDKSDAGIPLDQILTSWINKVKPSFDKYVNETKNHADVILPRGICNEGGVATIATYLLDAVASRLDGTSDLSASQMLVSRAGMRSLRDSDNIYYDSS